MVYLRWGLGLSLGTFMLAAVLRSVSWEEVLRSLGGFPWPLLLPAFGLVLLSFLVRAYRWRLLLPPSQRIPVGAILAVEATGSAINILSPVRILGDPAQLFLLVTRFRLEGGMVAATLVAARVIDLLVTMLLATGGILLVPALAPLRPIAGAGWALTAAILLALGLVHLGMVRAPWLQDRAPLQSYLRGCRELYRRRDVAAGVLVVTVVQWLLAALALWLVAQGLGIPIGFPAMVSCFLFALTAAGSVPSLPGVVGAFQLVWVFLLGTIGVPADMAFTFSVLAHLLLFLPPLVIAAGTLVALGVTWDQVRALTVQGQVAGSSQASR